jgi:hypothetical protein
VDQNRQVSCLECRNRDPRDAGILWMGWDQRLTTQFPGVGWSVLHRGSPNSNTGHLPNLNKLKFT